MKTALIMGITGNFGGAVAQALAHQGWSLRTLLRDRSRLPAQFRDIEVIEGDAMDRSMVRKAAVGVDLVVYGVNPPGYNWEGRAIPMLDNVAQVVKALGLTLLFPGNVYVFDPADGPEFNEQAPLRPQTSKGLMRQAMEKRLQQASEHGARVIVLRMGDFVGAGTSSTWFSELVKRGGSGFRSNGISVSCPGPADLCHTWAYLPDVAQAALALVERQETLPAWNVFHFRGHRMTLNEISQALSEVSGQAVRMKTFPWWAIRLMAPFSVLFRGLLEMRYLWQQPVNLDNTKLEQVLGRAEPHTPLAQVLSETGLSDEAPGQLRTV